MAVEPLVTTQRLHQQMTKGSKDLRIVDRTWYVPAEKRNTKKEYEEKHITGAIFFDIND